jgi:DNA-binding transcriptional LysR family regulator
MLSLSRLQTFREVATRRSFSAAADALGYTQSSVSQQISVLERELAVTLVDRSSRPIRPTPAGETVLLRAEELLGQAEAVEQELRGLAVGAGGTLRIGGFFTAWATFLPSGVAALARNRPAVRLELRQMEPDPALRALRGGELDLGVVYRLPEETRDAALRWTPLLDDHYAVALPARHRLADDEEIDLARLAGERWVCPPLETAYTQFLLRLCRERGGFTPDVAFQTADIAMAQPLVAAGLAVALLPRLGLEPRHGGVAVRRLGQAPVARSVWAVQHAGRRLPVAVVAAEELVLAARRTRL